MRIGIFGKIFGYGLLLAALGTTAAFLLTTYVLDFILNNQLQPVAKWLVQEALVDAPGRPGMLGRLYEVGRIRASLFDGKGTMISSTPEPYAALGPEELSRLRSAGMLELVEPPALAFAAPGGPAGYGITGFRNAGRIEVGPLTLASIFLLTALIAWPIAASLSRPIRELRSHVSRFGGGEWQTRMLNPPRDEIGALGEAFNEMAARVQKSIESEKLLLAAISHELRTPLQRVRLALELASDSDSEPRQLRATMADLDDLDRILSDVLTFSRLDRAAVPTADRILRLQTFAPEDLLTECAMRFEEAHPGRELSWTAAPGLPKVEGDARLLRRAVLNLLDNAARYSPPSSAIHLEARVAGSEIAFEVRDRGPGIPQDQHQRIFEPFLRRDEARTTPGSGLGLAIVQRIAQAHGGRVELDSSPQGASFCVVLPAARDKGALA